MFTLYRMTERVFGIIREEDYDVTTHSRKDYARRHGFISVGGDSYEKSVGVYTSLSDELIESKELSGLEQQARKVVFKVDL